MTRMTVDEAMDVAGIVKNVCQLAVLITPEQARAAVEVMSREEALMPVFDPSRYQKEGSAIRMNLEALRAFREFRERLSEIGGKP